jgi:hypothetical protein
MRSLELLLEHNIINLPDLERWVDEIANQCSFPEGKDWARAKFRKFLINADQTSDLVAGLTPNAPSWMQQRFSEGTPLHRFRPDQQLRHDLTHIVDYLNSLHTYATQNQQDELGQTLQKEARNTLPKLPKVSVEQAMVHAEKWFQRINRSVGDNPAAGTDGTQLVMKTPVGSWFELLTPGATKYEGSKMSHCVGGGSYTVGEDGTYRIFSLRDAKNEPHVTLSVNKNSGALDQIKGKQNQPPIAKYQQAVIDLLNQLHPEPGSAKHDLDRMAIRYRVDKDTLDTVYGSIADVAEKVGEIDGVSIFSLPEPIKNSGWNSTEGVKNNYYIYKKHMYAHVKMDYNNHLDAIEWYESSSKQGVRDAVWAIIAQFLNSLDPVPAPDSTVTGIKGPVLYRNGYYGPTRADLSEEVGFLSDGSRVMMLWTDKVKIVDIYDAEGTHRLSLEQSQQTRRDEVEYLIGATKVEGVEPPSPETIIDAILLADLKGGPMLSLRNLGVWPQDVKRFDDDQAHKDYLPLQPFNDQLGEQAGLVKIADDLYGGNLESKPYKAYEPNAPRAAWLYDNKGCKVAEIKYLSSTHDSMRGLVSNAFNHDDHKSSEKFKEHVEKELRSHPQQVAEWFNKIDWDMPKRPFQREQLHNYHVVRKAGKWVAVTDAKVAADYDGWLIKTVNKAITVTSPEGKVVILANKGREMLDGIKIVKSEGSSKTRHTALLTLDKYIQEYEDDDWYIDFDDEEWGLAMCTRGDNNRVVPVFDKYPPREIKTYPDGTKWEERALEVVDILFKNSIHRSWPCEGKYSLLNAEDKLLCRVFAVNGAVRLILIGNLDAKQTETATSDTIVGFLPALTDLIRDEKLDYDRSYFGTKLNITLVNGEVRPLEDDKRLQEFLRGKITYEDGKRWQKPSHGKYTWELVDTEEYENWEGKTMTRDITLAMVKLDGDGIEKVKVQKNRKNPKALMGYIMDLAELAFGSQDD